jgi:hypothetical protein
MRFICSLALFAVISGCSKDPILQTNIAGLDLSKEQSVEYFRANPEPTKEFGKWCKDMMVDPIPKDQISILFHKNCESASLAIMIPNGKIEGSRKYKEY